MANVGEKVSEKQKALFERILNVRDLEDIAIKTELSYSTIRDIYRAKNNLTSNNVKGYYEMIRKSLQKTEDALTFFEKAKSELNQMIPKP